MEQKLTEQEIGGLIDTYRDGLLEDTVPFWLDHCVDRENGGFMFCLDRDGTVVDTDKGMWIQGRFAWLLSTLYATVEARDEWLATAKHGLDFINEHGFDEDGKMFFQVTREGHPLRKRRYLSTEGFASIGYAAYGKAAGDESAVDKAYELFRFILQYGSAPSHLKPKVRPDVRILKKIGGLMSRIYIAQNLKMAREDSLCNEVIDQSIEEIAQDFIKTDRNLVLETVGPNGEFIDHFDGRLVTPGHLIEVAWFILHEARVRGGDSSLVEIGCKILDWAWEFGWDEEHGGIIYFRDVHGLPVTEYWHDMKFWWPQNETIIATLLAYHLTGQERYLSWFRKIHDWTYSLFPDPEYGEWFGYFHRDGRLSIPLKGNLWKGPFHMPRMQWYCWQLLEEMRGKP